jgi:hypothetical protein
MTTWKRKHVCNKKAVKCLIRMNRCERWSDEWVKHCKMFFYWSDLAEKFEAMPD